MTNPPPAPLLEAANGRILVVDDDAVTRELLRDLLEAQGHQVMEAASGEEALRAAAEGSPDTILLDVMMPAMDGFETCRRLKLDPQTAVVPVLLVTALSARRERLLGIETGAADFLSKPIDRQDVVLRVRNAVRLKQLHDRVRVELDRVRALESLRDDLVHLVVHDMRSPLQGAMLGVQVLSVQLDPVLTGRQKEGLDRTLGVLRHLAQMTNAVLDVNRMEQGKMPLQLDVCELKGAVQRSLDELRPLLTHLRVDVVAPDGPVELRADISLVERVLVNLIGNSAKFTPEGGGLSIAVSSGPTVVRVEVSDTGDGIPEAHRKLVFEKFGQAEMRREHRKYSTGLGLAFCRLAVEAHGGRIDVDSEVGHGSTFWFELPVGGPGEQRPQASPVLSTPAA